MSKKSNLQIDYDRVWAALSRSTQAKKALENVAEEVERTAKQIAKSEAFDTGDYADGIEVLSLPAKAVRKQLRGKTRARGERFANPLLNADFKGDPDGGAYDGTVSVVAAKDWKSALVEFGSLARNPSLVLTRSAEQAEKAGVKFTLLFRGETKSQDLEELGRRMAEKRPGGRD